MTEKNSNQVSDTKHSFQEPTQKFNTDIIKGGILTVEKGLRAIKNRELRLKLASKLETNHCPLKNI